MKKIKNNLKIILLTLLISIIGFFIYEIFFSMENLVVKQVTIEKQNIPQELSNLKIGVISDIKYQKFMDKDRLSKMIDAINKENIDVLLFLGDLFHENLTESTEITTLTELLSKLNAKKGKFYVLGDQDNPELVGKILLDANFESLDNKSTKLYFNNQFIQLIGIDINNNQNIYETISKNEFSLVMTHYPEIADTVPESIDLVVAGHTLGKQINIPIFSSFEKIEHSSNYILGEYDLKNNSKLYVNGGLGTVNNDIRLFFTTRINNY